MRKTTTFLLTIAALLYLLTSKPVPVATAPEALAPDPEQLIRFHVIANSDTSADQALKRKVRDAIVQKMAPEFRMTKTLAEAKKFASQNLPRMEQIATGVIKQAGKPYPVKASFGRFQFPTKTYGKFTLPAGEYEAVRIVIGRGEGSNWWCVLFPPLCFIDLTHSLAANPALLANNPNAGDGSFQPGSPSSSQQTTEQGKIEIRFKTLELWNRIFHPSK